jgi:hypothetical protein
VIHEYRLVASGFRHPQVTVVFSDTGQGNALFPFQPAASSP